VGRALGSLIGQWCPRCLTLVGRWTGCDSTLLGEPTRPLIARHQRRGRLAHHVQHLPRLQRQHAPGLSLGHPHAQPKRLTPLVGCAMLDERDNPPARFDQGGYFRRTFFGVIPGAPFAADDKRIIAEAPVGFEERSADMPGLCR
jgi:hypothetical protein